MICCCITGLLGDFGLRAQSKAYWEKLGAKVAVVLGWELGQDTLPAPDGTYRLATHTEIVHLGQAVT